MSTMGKESGMMSSNNGLGVNGCGRDTGVDWSMYGDWSLDVDVVDDLSNMDLGLDVSDLWSDLSMGSDRGQNLDTLL